MKSTALSHWWDRLLGRGDAAVTVPPLDGALKPNNRLDEAQTVCADSQPDNLVALGSALLYTSGSHVRTVNTSTGRVTHAAPLTAGRILAMAASPSGRLAMATDEQGLCICDGLGSPVQAIAADHALFKHTTAMTFVDDISLLVCVGSSVHDGQNWQRDLLTGGRSGSVWRVNTISGDAQSIAQQLAYPNGIALASDGSYIVSESWEKSLIKLSPDGKRLGQMLEDLPAYPGRLSPSTRGGYWLCAFAPRNQLIEFVLREPAYRRAMMEEVDPSLWIAPALRSGQSVLEPMQGGALKQMGILKPWAPTRSYGLVIELSDAFVPLQSLHSRAGGSRHGMTSAIEHQGMLWATAKGGDALVCRPPHSQA